MTTILHILTKRDDSLAEGVIGEQKQGSEFKVEVVDLTRPEPDYAGLVERIFAADSLVVW
jgi:hypothetical protein